jgi:heme O synthase-like polyprenyltransferase
VAIKIVLSHKIKNESENNKQVLSLFAPVTNYLTVITVALLVFTTAYSPRDRKSQLSPNQFHINERIPWDG